MKVSRKYQYAFLVFMSLFVLFYVVHKTVGFFYAINDDITMQKLASGSITGTPDAHLVFIRYPLGLVISKLFTFVPQYDWYGIFMLGSIFFCFFLILYRVFIVSEGKKNSGLIRLAGITGIIMLIIDSAIMFQFTVVAGILSATALFYYASSSTKTEIRDCALAWVLLLAASVVRFKVFYMAAPFMLWITFVKLLNYKKLETSAKEENKYVKRLIVIALITLVGIVISLSFMRIEKVAYSETPWKEYQVYKHARSQIMDYYKWPAYADNKEFWDSIDISEEEYDCLELYGILPNMSQEKIIEIYEYADSIYNISFKEHLFNMKVLLVNVLNTEANRATIILLIISFAVCVVRSIKNKDRFEKVLVLGAIILIAAELLYLLYMGRLPVRVVTVFNYQGIMLFIGILFYGIQFRSESYSTRELAAWLLCILVLMTFTLNQKSLKLEAYKKNLAVYQSEVDYVKGMKDDFLVLPSGTFVTVKQFSVHEMGSVMHNTTGSYGWSVYSPWNNKRLEDYNLKTEDNILLYPNVYMLTAKLEYADNITAYYLSEGLVEDNYEIIETKTFSDGRTIYKLKWSPAQ